MIYAGGYWYVNENAKALVRAWQLRNIHSSAVTGPLGIYTGPELTTVGGSRYGRSHTASVDRGSQGFMGSCCKCKELHWVQSHGGVAIYAGDQPIAWWATSCANPQCPEDYERVIPVPWGQQSVYQSTSRPFYLAA